MGLNYLPYPTHSQRIQMGRGIQIASTIEDPSYPPKPSCQEPSLPSIGSPVITYVR